MKKTSTWYGEILDSAVVAELCPPKKLREPEVVVPEPLPEQKPFVRVSATVVKRVRAETCSVN